MQNTEKLSISLINLTNCLSIKTDLLAIETSTIIILNILRAFENCPNLLISYEWLQESSDMQLLICWFYTIARDSIYPQNTINTCTPKARNSAPHTFTCFMDWPILKNCLVFQILIYAWPTRVNAEY